MQPITPAYPAWYTTFPHIIAPREEEWLAGLLLRCDEANSWESGGTLACLLDASPSSRLTTGFNSIREEHLEKLASALALPLEDIVATTYQAELARLSDEESQHPALSSVRPLFHICPLCVAEGRPLSRLLCLPGITCCPQHQLRLVERCQCGNPLRPFDRYALPFVCGHCQLAWARLPVVQADHVRIANDEALLSYYQFFLSERSPAIFACALRLVTERHVPQGRSRSTRFDTDSPSLEKLVHRLLERGLSPGDIRLAMGDMPDYSG